MKNLIFIFGAFAIGLSQMSCGGKNYITSMSNQNSDDAIYQDALIKDAHGDPTGAVTRMADLSQEYRDRPNVTESEAGFNAEICGLNFLNYVNNLGSAGATTPFDLFRVGFTGVGVAPAFCQTAQSVIDNRLGNTSATRIANLGATEGTNVNTFMAVLGMAKIGSTLKSVADLNSDDVVDAGFKAGADSCDPVKFPDASVIQVGTGFALILSNIAAIGSVASGATGALTALSASCALMTPNPCTITDPADANWANPAVLKSFRSLVYSSTVGIGPCVAAGHPLFPFDCCP